MTYRDDFRSAERDTWWTMPRAVLALVVVVLIMYGIGFIATGGDLAIYKFWAPKMEDAKRDVFQNTQSYVQGKQEYISRLRYQYQSATGPQRDALRTMILDESATVDITKLSPDLQAFIRGVRGGL